ncbi:MAG: FG-GAP repeat protein, partial [Chloroflexi bacterium]|nr:FG-GAP repeat protein [Chloroflexota bacterium]
GSYRVGIDVQQTVFVPRPVFGDKTAPAEQASSLRVEALVRDASHARLSLTDGSFKGRQPQTDLSASNSKEMLIADGNVFERVADQWINLNDFASTPGLTGDGLMMLSVAKNIQRLDPAETLGGSFERVAFTLDSRDVLAFMLQQQGQLDEKTWTMLMVNGLQYGGAGELWIAPTGLPERLKLDLAFQRGGREGFNAHAISTASYSSFGEQFPASQFDPNLTPLTQTPAAPIDPKAVPLASSLPNTIGLALLSLSIVALSGFLITRSRVSRKLNATIVSVLIVGMIAPSTVYAAAPDQALGVEEQSSEPSALDKMLINARQLGQRQQEKIAQAATDLIEFQDEDGDTLPNGYELKLGTNPFAKDSDLDGLDDAEEVLGHDCTYGQSIQQVETDPLNPDSNSDGIRDGDEFDHGVCRFTDSQPRPYAWSDDNDSDNVPDSLDMSPFSKSDELGGKRNTTDDAYTTRIDGANMTFEMLDGNYLGAPREVYYYEVQVRPLESVHLQYAYKSALEWPQDDQGMIQNNTISGTSGLLQIAPFLQVTIDASDLPSVLAMTSYGISATQTGNGSYQMILPLVPVERGGRVYALQAKVYQDRASLDNTIRWRDMRLKWAVQGDVLRPADDGSGQMVPSSTGNYGLIIYDEGYMITGVRVSRQAGASAIVAGASPTPGQRFDAGPIALLRAGLEAQYLSGRLSLTDVYTRFNVGNTATITEHWGITHTYRVSQPQNYQHLDQMLLNVNVTTTRSILNSLYPSHNVSPTLIIATEQRTATLNVDELTDVNFNDLTMNLCVKQLATSRSLKLATYKFDPTAGSLLVASLPHPPPPSPEIQQPISGEGERPLPSPDDGTRSVIGRGGAQARGGEAPFVPMAGDWTALGLDEILKDVQKQFDEIYGQIEQYYNDALTVLEMATTVWHQGQTVMQSIGDLNLTDITDALSDPNFYADILKLLDKYGLLNGLPAEFRQVVDFLLGVLEYPGGPGKWLEDQWNTVVGYAEDVVGGFKDFFAGDVSITPASLIEFTQTAINVLTWLASIIDLDFLGDVIKVLYRLLEIFKKIQELWNTIQILVTKGTQVVSEVLKAVTGELASLSGNLAFVGLIITVFASLFSMFMQIATGNLSVLGVIGVVLKAIFEIALAIVLFVVATIFPIGTLVAIAIAIVKLVTGFLKDYFGKVGEVIAAFLDPIGAFLDAVNPDPEPLVSILGSPQVGPMQFRSFDDAPLGGLIAGDRFGFTITGTVTMSGESDALKRSKAWVRLGRYANGDGFELCGVQILQFFQSIDDLESWPEYAIDTVTGGCATFYLKRTLDWNYSRDDDHSKSGIYWTNKIPGLPNVDLPLEFRVRDYFSTARLTITPRKPKINGVVSTDISLGIKQTWENCGIFGLDCDVYDESYESPPSVSYIYFDIMPRTLTQLWNWTELTNHDPDGDDMDGNIDQGVFGIDNGLCGYEGTHLKLSSEPGANDNLSDRFELFDYESSPCLYDTDSDSLPDDEEFVLGTYPDKADTDEDGLSDGEEAVEWYPYASSLVVPWRIEMNGAYAGLPNPAAFPNPRLANADKDGRSDKKEKEQKSGPSAFNLEKIDVSISQELVYGGGTRIKVGSYPWQGDQTLAQTPVLTVALPIAFNNVSTSAKLLPVNANPQLNQANPIGGMPANSYGWAFAPLGLNRQFSTTITGLPATIPPGVVTVTAQLSYVESGISRVVTDAVELLINRGGPIISVTLPTSGSIESALYSPIRLQGNADDPEGVSSVQVCVKTTPVCTAPDWHAAVVGSLYGSGWYYDFTPPADGTYNLFVRGYDQYGVQGPIAGPIVFYADSTIPSGGTFNIKPLQFVSTTFSVDSLAAFTVTGRLTETTGGAYVSGLGNAQVLAQHITLSGTEYLRGQSILSNPGAVTSAFSTTFSLPIGPNGKASPSAQGLYLLNLGAIDRAGNVRANSDSTYALVDDDPPFTFIRPPQTISTTTINLGGRADDTALNGARNTSPAYPISQTLSNRDTAFLVDQPADLQSEGHIIGDLNGDTIDDVATVTFDPAKPIEVGIFFGKPNGYTSTLDYTQADVRIFGEVDFTGPYSWTPGVAINPPGLFDVNGDGISELLIGDPNVNAGHGRAYLLSGRRTWPATINLSSGADWRISPAATLAFGGSVASAGDFDGDGLADVIVGAATDGTVYEPMYLYLGRERGVPAGPYRYNGRVCLIPPCTPALMPNLAGVGDTNGDGLSDILMAMNQSVWLINGRSKPELPTSALASLYAIARFQGDGQQQTVSPAGDVNGDGLRDMLIGDPLPGVSRLHGVFGRRPENPFPLVPSALSLTVGSDLSFKEIVGAVGYPPLGEGLAPMGDLDRDGKDDFAFGRAGVSGGAAIVLSGRTPWLRDMPFISATLFIYGTLGSQQAGGYLSAGDIDGNGIRDIMVGAPGTNASFLHEADLPFMIPSGVARVEVGVTGPITNPNLPYTSTLPTTWQVATLGIPNASITPLSATLTFGADGDYRVYARATDRAGNQLPNRAWFIGESFVNRSAAAIPTISGTLNTPMLYREGFLRVNISGTLISPNPIQAFRTFDGERWTRQPLFFTAPGPWFDQSNIERSDQRTITFRSVARDAFGNVIHSIQRVTTDTLIARPVISGNLQGDKWYTNITPTLVITWNPIIDANPITRYAVIDQISNTLPTSVVGVNQVSRVLDAPGAWYAHVRVVDSAGNQRVVHDGPYLINRLRTPSAILPDGLLDFANTEYTEGMFATYDPYAIQKPALMLATWDANKLYLGFTGSDWNLEKRLAIYLDTQAGGSTSSLGPIMPGGEAVHTLPFAADYALVISGVPTYTIYSNTGAGWIISPTNASYAIANDDTEIVFDRNGIGATAGVPVSMLAYVAVNDGVGAIIPSGARISTTQIITGPITFTDKVYWPSLANGYPSVASDLPTQWIAPLVKINPGFKTQLQPNEVATLTITVNNVDVLSYNNQPMTVTLGQAPALMNFVSLIGGASCQSCPANSRQWVLQVDASAGQPATVTLTAKALTPASTGVFSVPVSATLAYQGLPNLPQPPATTAYAIDNSVGKAKFAKVGPIVFAPPGVFKLPLYIDLGSPFLMCKAQSVSINKGAGFSLLGALGAVQSVTHTLPAGYNQLWTLQVQSTNGKVSTDTVTVKTDGLVPSVQFTPTLVFTKAFGLLKGLAFDDSGFLSSVEVSLNGGAFKKALLGDGSVLVNAPQVGQVEWTLPIDAANTDGDPLQVVARAVDAAGNVGPNSAPITITLDTTGPTINVSDAGSTVSGTVFDGSGVSEVAISLDGGTTYQLATLNGSNWSFNRTTWVGGTPIAFVMIRARDVYGNESQTVDVSDVKHVYLPVVRR